MGGGRGGAGRGALSGAGSAPPRPRPPQRCACARTRTRVCVRARAASAAPAPHPGAERLPGGSSGEGRAGRPCGRPGLLASGGDRSLAPGAEGSALPRGRCVAVCASPPARGTSFPRSQGTARGHSSLPSVSRRARVPADGKRHPGWGCCRGPSAGDSSKPRPRVVAAEIEQVLLAERVTGCPKDSRNQWAKLSICKYSRI